MTTTTIPRKKKVKLDMIKCFDYAITWDQFGINRKWNEEHPIATWDEMETLRRRHFVPNYYYQHLYKKFQSLTQCDMNPTKN